MRFGGAMRVCCTFRRLRNDHCPTGVEQPAKTLAEYKAKALQW